MFSFMRVALVMVSLHSNGMVTRTESINPTNLSRRQLNYSNQKEGSKVQKNNLDCNINII